MAEGRGHRCGDRQRTLQLWFLERLALPACHCVQPQPAAGLFRKLVTLMEAGCQLPSVCREKQATFVVAVGWGMGDSGILRECQRPLPAVRHVDSQVGSSTRRVSTSPCLSTSLPQRGQQRRPRQRRKWAVRGPRGSCTPVMISRVCITRSPARVFP